MANSCNLDPKISFVKHFSELCKSLINFEKIMKDADHENPQAFWKEEDEKVLKKFENKLEKQMNYRWKI